jgi:hypothetical protein
VPPPHTSFRVHALPSSHGLVLLVWTQPVAGLHVSVVHGLPSSQFSAGPPAQAPPEHASFVVQALPSLHGALLFTWVHPVAGLQPSSVQPFPSLQFGAGPPTQWPAPSQWSPVVQALPSLHGVLLPDDPSTGQVLFVPSQTSATSHVPVEERHTMPEAFAPSAGQSALEPLQVSATSQRSLAARQTPPVTKPSAGQLMLVPVHVSAASHGPAGARHCAPALPATWRQTPNVASHESTVQAL